jgi:RNA polymerase sigma factor (TIGR02999 family)
MSRVAADGGRSPDAEDPRPAERSDAAAAEFDALVGICYPELKGIARQLLAGERSGHTLQATALVHEAWVRLRSSAALQLKDADHCLRIVARAMRRLLIDHARARKALRHGGQSHRQSLDEIDSLALREFAGWEHLEDLDRALEELERKDPQLVRIVEAKIFAELTDADGARTVGIGITTYKKRWVFARAWLHARLAGTSTR